MKTKEEEKTVPAVFCNILRGVGSVASIFPADGEPRRVSMPERTDSQALANVACQPRFSSMPRAINTLSKVGSFKKISFAKFFN